MSGMFNRVRGWLFEEEVGGMVADNHVDPQPSARRRRSSLLSLHSSGGEEIFIKRPQSRDDAPICAEHLRQRCPVIINLKSLDSEVALRVFDFLAGVVYALDGQMEPVGEGIFLLTPRDFDIAKGDDENRVASLEHVGFWQEQ